MTPTPLSDSTAVAAYAERLAAAPFIALDTEFLRERTYRPQLCLLQLSGGGEAALIDPLSDANLEPLAKLLNSSTVPKILHAARQDLEVLWPLCGAVQPLFDTQVAASLIGMPAQIGYSELLRRLLNIDLAKAETRTDWSKRPLSEAQLRYALDDVAHLPAMREILTQRLSAAGRLQWFESEMQSMGLSQSWFIEPEKAVERLRWVSELDSERARLAQKLAAWRERRASEKNRPRGWIVDDNAIRAMVLNPPRTMEALAQIPDLTPGFVERTGGAILAIIDGAQLSTELPPLAQRARPDAAHMARVKQLAAILQKKAVELDIVAEVLATRRELESIARGETTADVLTGWRRDVVGNALLAAG
jgi:ribonuclease D